MKIKVKLTLKFFFIVAMILISLMYFVYSRFEDNITKEYYNNLKSKATMTADMVLQKGDIDKLERNSSRKAPKVSLPNYDNVMIYNEVGEIVFMYNRGVIVKLPFLVTNKFQIENSYRENDSYYFGLPYISPSGRKYYVVATSVINSKELDSLRRIIIISIILGLFIIGVIGYLYVRDALKPIFSIIDQMDNLNVKNFIRKLDQPNSKDEISHLTNSINFLLQKVHESFEFQKMFVANVSHELNNLISVILSQADVALDKSSRPAEEYKETLESVKRDVYELSVITENLMQLAKLKSEDFQLRQEFFQVDEALFECKNKLHRIHKDYIINIDIVGQPDSEKDLTIYGNAGLLKLAFCNLMDNACKYSNDKEVFVSMVVNHQKLSIQFRDNGHGIETETIKDVFKPFYRNRSAYDIKGFGIGLSLIRAVLDVHCLNLDIESTPNIGSTFTIDFMNVQVANK